MGAIAMIITLAALVPAIATDARAHQPSQTDHGVNATTFAMLWSGDKDGSQTPTQNGSAAGWLASGTDVPFDRPPRAVAVWNRGELTDFPETDANRSVFPPQADRTNGTFIKDAYTELFAVQPTTNARLSPTETPRYAAPHGHGLGTIDYRVEAPPDDTTGDRRVFWSLHDHRINETRLRIDGAVETRRNGSHTPSLAYSELAEYSGNEHRLTLAATVHVVLQKRIEVCVARDLNGNCIKWDVTIRYPTETIVVQDSMSVVEYDLSVSGFAARYPNGDLGRVLYKNKPWLGYALPTGDVRGVWRFYTARDTGWDTLVTSTENNTTRSHSPLHPLQVNAYPIETGPTASPPDSVTILATYGDETQPPTLPPNISLDSLTESYTASYGIATRSPPDENGSTAVTAYGLVRGVTIEVGMEQLASTSLRHSNLTLTVINRTTDTVTVRAHLTDPSTGAPIATTDRGGSVVLAGERVNTRPTGTVTRTLPSGVGSVSARYEPGRWWRYKESYTPDSDVVFVRGTVLQAVALLYRAAIPVSVVLVAIFIIDRLTGWRVWPPWRRV
jgi:hypothetical protein